MAIRENARNSVPTRAANKPAMSFPFCQHDIPSKMAANGSTSASPTRIMSGDRLVNNSSGCSKPNCSLMTTAIQRKAVGSRSKRLTPEKFDTQYMIQTLPTNREYRN